MPLNDDVDIFTISEFRGMIVDRALDGSDGTGYYGSETHESSFRLNWRQIYDDIDTKLYEGYTHVWWYNK